MIEPIKTVPPCTLSNSDLRAKIVNERRQLTNTLAHAVRTNEKGHDMMTFDTLIRAVKLLHNIEVCTAILEARGYTHD